MICMEMFLNGSTVGSGLFQRHKYRPNGPKVGPQKVARGGSWNPPGKITPSAFCGVLPRSSNFWSWLSPLPRTFSLTAMNPFSYRSIFISFFSFFISGGTNPYLDQFGRSYLGGPLHRAGRKQCKD